MNMFREPLPVMNDAFRPHPEGSALNPVAQMAYRLQVLAHGRLPAERPVEPQEKSELKRAANYILKELGGSSLQNTIRQSIFTLEVTDRLALTAGSNGYVARYKTGLSLQEDHPITVDVSYPGGCDTLNVNGLYPLGRLLVTSLDLYALIEESRVSTEITPVDQAGQ